MSKERIKSTFGLDIYCEKSSKCKFRSICLCAWETEPTNDDYPISLVKGNMRTFECLTLDEAHWEECGKVYLKYLNDKIKKGEKL